MLAWPRAAKLTVQLKYFRKPLRRVISPADAFAGWTRSTEYREALNKRDRTRSVRKTDLHPLVRCDEGMKGLDPLRHGSENR